MCAHAQQSNLAHPMNDRVTPSFCVSKNPVMQQGRILGWIYFECDYLYANAECVSRNEYLHCSPLSVANKNRNSVISNKSIFKIISHAIKQVILITHY